MTQKYHNLTVQLRTKDRADRMKIAFRKVMGRAVHTDELVNILMDRALAGQSPTQLAEDVAREQSQGEPS